MIPAMHGRSDGHSSGRWLKKRRLCSSGIVGRTPEKSMPANAHSTSNTPARERTEAIRRTAPRTLLALQRDFDVICGGVIRRAKFGNKYQRGIESGDLWNLAQ